MTIHRVTAQWSGFTGAPGYSNFHFSPFTGGGDVDQEIGRVRSFFSDIISVMPSDMSVQVSSTVELIDEETGVLEGYLEGEEVSSVSPATGTPDYAGPVGAVINWLTNTVNNGRRVRGRTFIVPIRSTSYEGDGTLTSDALSTLRDAASDFVQDEFESGFVVWSRPRNGAGGLAAPVTGSRVPDLAAVLRSRRD